jgi:hypothetical protein
MAVKLPQLKELEAKKMAIIQFRYEIFYLFNESATQINIFNEVSIGGYEWKSVRLLLSWDGHVHIQVKV